MALSTTQYGYIIDPMVPFTDDKGKTIKNGFVRVFVEGSSTPVVTYRNFDGATNQDRIELDNSGRTKTGVIGSKGLTYKVCVYDAFHSQESPILTVDKVSVIGANITAGTGATVVTGLDGLTTKPDGFVDASVIGTDGYVALDHTLVTDDLNTDAKVTAVENDRYIPLLNDDVNDPDSKMTLKRLKLWVHNDNVVTAGTIYPTLQDAIADADDLSVGDIFETNGFHTNGDGGAARYLVSDTGTANGMNIVQLAAGKLAVLQVGDWINPEQLGYDHVSDVVPYISHAISNMAVQHIHLTTKGAYHWKSALDVNKINGFELIGEGDWGSPRKFSYINVDPSTNINYMMKLAGRSISVKNIDIEVTGSQKLLIDGIICDSYADGAEFYFTFDNIRMNSFKECWRLSGGIKWHMIFNECQPANSVIGIHIRESSSMLVNMREVFFNHCSDIGLWFEGNIFTAKIDSCNFGSMNTAIKCSVNAENYLYQNIEIDSCNFEDDNVDVGNRPAVFIDCYDSSHLDIRQNLTISNSNFTLAKYSAPIQDTTNRYIRFGKNTNIVLINNQIFGMNEPEHPTWEVYPKLMWNTSVIPTEGSICEFGMNLFFDYPDALSPYVTRNGRAIGFRCYNAEDPAEQAIADCDDFLPLHNGEMRVGRVSSYENTANLPTTNIFGYLMVFGVIDGSNKRVIQVLFSSDNNIYTRLVRDTGNGWTYLAWKTITAA